MSFSVLFEDNHLLVVFKPAGLLAQGDATGDCSLVDLAKAYRKTADRKKGNVYVGLVHRLDRPVSGVVVLAKTSKATERLCQQFRGGTVRKVYLAVVDAPAERPAGPDTGVWSDALVKNRDTNRSRIVSDSVTGVIGKRSETRWQLLAAARNTWLLSFEPLTGRSHQLRLQTASRGMPILGDRKYGSKHTFDGAIALHAWKLEFEHPTRGARLSFTCPPPESWDRFPFNLAAILGAVDRPLATDG